MWLLGATQVIGYGTVYYSFAILAADIAASFAVPVSVIFGAFSAALLAGGFAAPLVGRRVDRHGAPVIMAAGSLATALALAATAAAPGPIGFALALAAVQLASTMVLYDTAFAALVQACGPGARRRITHLTLIAGFASTLFWPLTTLLHGIMDWRAVMLAFAAINLVVCLPIHLLIAVRTRGSAAAEAPAPAGGTPAEAPAQDPPLPPRLARRAFALVSIGFALSGFLLSAVLAQMVPLLTALGLGSSALAVAALFGPAQVLVRFINMLVGVRRHPLAVTLFAMAMLPLAVVILAGSAPLVVGAGLFAVLLGFGSGLKSILQGTLPLALFGSVGYGAMLGRLAMVRQFLAAAAPFAFALVMDTAGAIPALALLVAVAAAGFLAFVEVARIRARAAIPPTTLAGRPA